MVNCSNCGSPLRDDAKFCENCGVQVQQQPAPQYYPQQYYPQQESNVSMIAAAIVVIVAIIIVISLLVFVIIPKLTEGDLSGNDVVTGDTDKFELVTYDTVEKSDWMGNYYEVTGTVKNIADEMMDVVIKVSFYDDNDNYLGAKYDYIYNLASSYSNNFKITYYESEPYYNDFDHVKFEIEEYEFSLT